MYAINASSALILYVVLLFVYEWLNKRLYRFVQYLYNKSNKKTSPH